MKRIIILIFALIAFLNSCAVIQSDNTPDYITIATYAQIEIQNQTGKEVEIPLSEEEWNIMQSDLFYAAKATVKIDGNPSEIIYRMEFDDDTYKSWKIISLEIDGEYVIDNR